MQVAFALPYRIYQQRPETVNSPPMHLSIATSFTSGLIKRTGTSTDSPVRTLLRRAIFRPPPHRHFRSHFLPWEVPLPQDRTRKFNVIAQSFGTPEKTQRRSQTGPIP